MIASKITTQAADRTLESTSSEQIAMTWSDAMNRWLAPKVEIHPWLLDRRKDSKITAAA